MPKKSYNCPAPWCSRKFYPNEKKGKLCPCEKVQLKWQVSHGGGGYGMVETDSEDKPVIAIETKESHSDPELPMLVSDRGEIPEVWLSGPGREDGKLKEYIVKFSGIIFTGSVRCPSCWRPVLDCRHQTMLDGEQEVRCSRGQCQAIIKVVFSSNSILPHRTY